VPLAQQLRQLDQQTGPEEPKLLRKYAVLGYLQIRATYGLQGSEPILREVGKLTPGGELVWIPVHTAELELAQHNAAQDAARLIGRIQSRLVGVPANTPLAQLSEEQRRILRMSNAEFGRFRAAGGNPAPAPQGAALAQQDQGAAA